MKIKNILLACATIMLLSTSPTWAQGGNGNNGVGNQCQGNSCGSSMVAPEINAKSGTNAIALLIGGLLLAAERRRSLGL